VLGKGKVLLGRTLTGLQALGQAVDGNFLVLEGAVLVVNPAKLLQNFGVIRVFLHNALVSILRTSKLWKTCEQSVSCTSKRYTYIFLLLVHVANLEPDVGMCKRARRVPQDAVKAV
jgi:hypothetical protein